MDSCPFVRVLVSNLALRMPAASCSPPPLTRGGDNGEGVALAVRGGGGDMA
jgi:hypothetical protein